jgi:hypothetical protein
MSLFPRFRSWLGGKNRKHKAKAAYPWRRYRLPLRSGSTANSTSRTPGNISEFFFRRGEATESSFSHCLTELIFFRRGEATESSFSHCLTELTSGGSYAQRLVPHR